MQSTHQIYLAVKTCQVILLISVTSAELGPSPATNTEIGSTPAVYLYSYKLHCHICYLQICNWKFHSPQKCSNHSLTRWLQICFSLFLYFLFKTKHRWPCLLICFSFNYYCIYLLKTNGCGHGYILIIIKCIC